MSSSKPFLRLVASTLVLGAYAGHAFAREAGDGDARVPLLAATNRGAAEVHLKHIYAVYFGIRACTEISLASKDRSFLPEVSLEETRLELRRIDAATAEVGIDALRIWNDSAPQSLVTAEALKADPAAHLEHCHRMGSLFRVDASNLQADLTSMGAKTTLIPKDY